MCRRRREGRTRSPKGGRDSRKEPASLHSRGTGIICHYEWSCAGAMQHSAAPPLGPEGRPHPPLLCLACPGFSRAHSSVASSAGGRFVRVGSLEPPEGPLLQAHQSCGRPCSVYWQRDKLSSSLRCDATESASVSCDEAEGTPTAPFFFFFAFPFLCKFKLKLV